MTGDNVVAVHAGRAGRRAAAAGVAVYLLALLIGIVFIVAPPTGVWFGESGLRARILGVAGIPAALVGSVQLLVPLIRRGPLVRMDQTDLTSRTNLKSHTCGWAEIAKVTVTDQTRVLNVALHDGDRFAIRTHLLEDGWDAVRLAAEMKRLSGGRVTAI